MMEQMRQQNAEYQKSLEERISVLVEQQKQLAELNRQQAQELKSLRQRQLQTAAGNRTHKYTLEIYVVLILCRCCICAIWDVLLQFCWLRWHI